MKRKVQLLAFSRRAAVLLGICSSSGESNSLRGSVQIVIIFAVALNMTLALTSYTMFTRLQLINGNVTEFLFGSLHVTAVTCTLLSYISVAYHRQRMGKVFKQLQSMFDQCK